ncbi:unnamed protein product [Prunus armeniaca]|uniref:Uncharacterized protein n=1 Tax=Prunus armeniaca TaxID=36596 RepID=A0A6J5Y494_PRUAR|nr:unnamed protein product [Prunus armeniaca]CAB4318785.1 unnamed protein product [Prunus armeniaca]
MKSQLRDTKPNSQNNQSRTEQSEAEVGLFPQEPPKDGSGGKRRRIGDWHGQGDWGVAEYSEESSGGREVNEEGDCVLPDREELEPALEGSEKLVVNSAGLGLGLGRGGGFEGLVPEESAAAH